MSEAAGAARNREDRKVHKKLIVIVNTELKQVVCMDLNLKCLETHQSEAQVTTLVTATRAPRL